MAAGTRLGEHAARFEAAVPGVLQGTYSYVLQDDGGQISLTHSVSAGLDYPSIGPEHAVLHDQGRAEYVSASDAEALDACLTLARMEGIIPALESAHAVAECMKRAPSMRKSRHRDRQRLRTRRQRYRHPAREPGILKRAKADPSRSLVMTRGEQRKASSEERFPYVYQIHSSSRPRGLHHLSAIPTSRPRAKLHWPPFEPAPMCIELGVPFSDPVADGPVIQRASERALQHGTTLAGVLDIAPPNRGSNRRPG